MRKLAIEGKLKAIERYLADWKVSQIKLLVFGIHKEQLQYLSNKFKCPLIAGGVPSTKKRTIVKQWLQSDDVFLFANMQSAGTGVDDLQKVCSNMVILELPWKPADLTQVFGRIERSGQRYATTATFLLNDQTIDQEMWDMLAHKELVTEAVNKGVDVRKTSSSMIHVMKSIVNKK